MCVMSRRAWARGLITIFCGFVVTQYQRAGVTAWQYGNGNPCLNGDYYFCAGVCPSKSHISVISCVYMGGVRVYE